MSRVAPLLLLAFALSALSASAAPSATPPAAGRTVVDEHNALACVVDGKPVKGDECPLSGTGVGIAPLQAGPIRLPTGPLTLAAGNPEEMCGWQRTIASFDKATPMDVGRSVTPIELPSSTYSKLIAEHTGIKEPKITQLAKVDLEGDGKDEVLFVVDSGDTLYDAAGNGSTYAWVGVRRIGADGQVKTHMLYSHKASYTAKAIADGDIPTHFYGKILGVTDIDGDKKLEIVVEDGFYEGRTRSVWRVDDGGATRLGDTGCGA